MRGRGNGEVEEGGEEEGRDTDDARTTADVPTGGWWGCAASFCWTGQEAASSGALRDTRGIVCGGATSSSSSVSFSLFFATHHPFMVLSVQGSTSAFPASGTIPFHVVAIVSGGEGNDEDEGWRRRRVRRARAAEEKGGGGEGEKHPVISTVVVVLRALPLRGWRVWGGLPPLPPSFSAVL